MQHCLLVRLRLLAALSPTALSHASEAPTRSPELPYRSGNVAMGGAGFVSSIIAHLGKQNLIDAHSNTDTLHP
jgi:hypothetical protein